jgi:tetratricopeptide (TPR) repeat protein
MSPEATAAAAKASIAAAKKLSKVPDRATLQTLLAAEVALKDDAGVADALEEETADYNQPADWTQIIDITFGTPGLRDQDAIWLGRLMFVVGAPVSANDASMVGGIASQLAFFGDAVNAKTHGGAVDPDPAPRADSDKKTIPQQIAVEQAQDGTYNAKLSEALYSYGMYPEAEAAAKLAIQKGGNPDASEAPMVLGQALTAEGKYGDAVAAFGQVSGGGPATARIARLWADYASIKKK